MRLKDEFVTHVSGDQQIMVDVEGKTFTGMVRSNPTAAFIVNELMESTTVDEIVTRMLAKYDAPEEIIREDVELVIETLRKVGAIVE